MKKRTIVRLWSGLGNQIFQLAFALAKQEASNLSVELEVAQDDAAFRKLASFIDLAGLRIRTMPNGLRGRLYRLGCRFVWPRLVREKSWHYSAAVQKRVSGRFVGYWQSERYFADSKDNIQNRIDLSRISYSLNDEVGPAQRPRVAVHIRRGDYLNPKFGDRYDTVHEDYYKLAMGLIRKLLPDVTFLMFSDDPEWVEERYGRVDKIVVVRGNTDLQDLRLMAECDHQIIANSTFSWWAAWLNPNPNKIVIMPKQWSNVPGRKIDDIYMKGAIILNP